MYNLRLNIYLRCELNVSVRKSEVDVSRVFHNLLLGGIQKKLSSTVMKFSDIVFCTVADLFGQFI